jgi:hypothetical protein
MAFADELANLASEFTEQLGTATIKIIRRSLGAYTAASQDYAVADTEWDIASAVRSASVLTTVSTPGSAGFVKVEAFSYSVARADLVTAGWNGTDPLGENCSILDGAEVFPVVSVHRECGEKLLRFNVRRDLGTAG